MAESQRQNVNGEQAPTTNFQTRRSAPPSGSRSQGASEPPAPTVDTRGQQESVDICTIGGFLNVDVGNVQYVPVPNTTGKPPTRKEIYSALVTAGHQERAGELADRAMADMRGEEGEEPGEVNVAGESGV